jgi:hypothetical protein
MIAFEYVELVNTYGVHSHDAASGRVPEMAQRPVKIPRYGYALTIRMGDDMMVSLGASPHIRQSVIWRRGVWSCATKFKMDNVTNQSSLLRGCGTQIHKANGGLRSQRAVPITRRSHGT